MCAKRIDPKEYEGKKFYKLTAIKLSHMYRTTQVWDFRCDCGNVTVVPLILVRTGKTKSCGCLKRVGYRWTHGDAVHGKRHRIYNVWIDMRKRCFNPKSTSWKHYGGRGITVCSDWSNFENFKRDMWPSYLPGLTLDRINVNGNYEPANCRWASYSEQALNKRTARLISFNGETLNLETWSKRFGLKRSTIMNRLDRGWTIGQALTTAVSR